MKITSLFAALIIATFLSAQNPSKAPSTAPVLGTWEGESTCTIPTSPCHDEHVIYEIAADKVPGKVNIQADKVVQGKREDMGILSCTYDSAKKRLSCPMEGNKPSDWTFDLTTDTLTGTLVLRDGKQLYRRIRVQKKH